MTMNGKNAYVGTGDHYLFPLFSQSPSDEECYIEPGTLISGIGGNIIASLVMHSNDERNVWKVSLTSSIFNDSELRCGLTRAHYVNMAKDLYLVLTLRVTRGLL